MKTFKNFIGGDWVPPLGGEYFENQNPADISDSIGRFPLSGAADVERAVRYSLAYRQPIERHA